MKKIFKKSSILLVLAALTFIFFGCQRTADDSTTGSDTINSTTPANPDDTNNTPDNSDEPNNTTDNTNEDDTNESVTITVGNLTITTLKAYEKTVTSDEAAKTITFEPTEEKVEYTLSGSFEGQIINKTKNTVFILSGVSLSNTDGLPAVYGELKTEIKAEKETENTISVPGEVSDSKSGALQCDKALEIGGAGTLTVTCENAHGVKASKVELKGSGTFTFDGGADSSAVNCNEFVVDTDKTFTATFKDSKNGIKADETITIASGTFNFENITKVALKTDKDKDDPEKAHFIQLDGGTFSFTKCKKIYETETDKFTKAEAVEGDFE